MERVALGDLAQHLDASPEPVVLVAARPGDRVEVTFEQRGTTKTVEMLLAPNPQMVVVLYEDAGMAVTPEMTAFRTAWLTGGN